MMWHRHRQHKARLRQEHIQDAPPLAWVLLNASAGDPAQYAQYRAMPYGDAVHLATLALLTDSPL